MSDFDIVSIDPRAERDHEQMGSKPKFWYRSDAQSWLYKRCRAGTGEDWAEKISAEIAALLGLPHAVVELAELDGQRGSITLDFVGDHTLVHGNELLWQRDANYPLNQSWGVTAHSVANVADVLTSPALGPPPECTLELSAAQVFGGYLALDALIGNTDRHHENWALLRMGDRLALAPTYDHASSLGRELQDPKRKQLLDRGLTSYVTKARSALYPSPPTKKALHTHEAFRAFCERVPGTMEPWIARICALEPDTLNQIIHRVPTERMTPLAAQFAHQLMLENQRLLCAGVSR